ncbi:hypothetical protein [Sphingopyxis panaciterrae]
MKRLCVQSYYPPNHHKVIAAILQFVGLLPILRCHTPDEQK